MTPTSDATPRLYLNHDVPKSAAEALRKEGFDVVATVEVGLTLAGDEEQVLWAAGERRTIVSFNVRDYPSIHLGLLKRGVDHCGIVLPKQLRVRETIRALRHLLTTRTGLELRNQILWLGSGF